MLSIFWKEYSSGENTNSDQNNSCSTHTPSIFWRQHLIWENTNSYSNSTCTTHTPSTCWRQYLITGNTNLDSNNACTTHTPSIFWRQHLIWDNANNENKTYTANKPSHPHTHFLTHTHTPSYTQVVRHMSVQLRRLSFSRVKLWKRWVVV